MPLASALDRLQPCLFDRLIDLSPSERLEARSERVFSLSRYKEGVKRDMAWLLNASAHTEEEGLKEFPHVERSVFNFGKQGIAGKTVSTLDLPSVEGEIERAIRYYEPRIDPATVKVRCVPADEGKKRSKNPGTYNCLAFEISGELWAQPSPEKFLLKTTIDMETGMEPFAAKTEGP